MVGWAKIFSAGLVLAILGSVGMVVAHASRLRSKLNHCQRNCRFLGEIGARELYSNNGLDTSSSGRSFWQAVRILKWRTAKDLLPPEKEEEVFAKDCRESPCRNSKHLHEWSTNVRRDPLHPDPFLCPVRGTTLTSLDDPTSIDYRGAATIPETLVGRIMIGADRVGNHPDGGGFVIYAEGVSAYTVEYAAGESSPWKQASTMLSD